MRELKAQLEILTESRIVEEESGGVGDTDSWELQELGAPVL